MSVISNIASTMIMNTSHDGLDGKSSMLAWHYQSISTALQQQRHSIARALPMLKPKRQPVHEQALASCGRASPVGQGEASRHAWHEQRASAV
jgi:hypothetical protein